MYFKKPNKNPTKKKNQKDQQNIYYFYSHYTAVGNDLQTVQLTEHSVTGFMFSHILFNVMLQIKICSSVLLLNASQKADVSTFYYSY